MRSKQPTEQTSFQFIQCSPAAFRVFAIKLISQSLTNTSSCFLQVIQPEESGCRERLRSGKTILTTSCLSRCHSHVQWNIFSELQSAVWVASSISAGQSCKKKKEKQLCNRQKCLPPMCQVCFHCVAESQLPKPTCLKIPLSASRALFRFCSPVRNLQPLCEELGVVCSQPSACPTRWHRVQSAHMLSWFSTEEKLKAGSMPGWKSLSPVCT